MVLRHILPNAFTPWLVVATLDMARVIVIESALSFLGLGVQPPTPTWGGMLADGRVYISTAWWLATFPGLAILVTVLGINLFGDGLRDTLDPRLAVLGDMGGLERAPQAPRARSSPSRGASPRGLRGSPWPSSTPRSGVGQDSRAARLWPGASRSRSAAIGALRAPGPPPSRGQRERRGRHRHPQVARRALRSPDGWPGRARLRRRPATGAARSGRSRCGASPAGRWPGPPGFPPCRWPRLPRCPCGSARNC